MSKIIVNIDQISDGGTNPETGIIEDILWTLHFDSNGGARNIGRNQMLEYLTAGTSPIKNVHSFKKWDITTTQGNEIRTWVIVYDDHTHVQLVNRDFYTLIANGHRNKEEEKKESIEEEAEGQRGAVSKAIQQAQENAQTDRITSLEEKKELTDFRDKIKEETTAKGNYEDFRDLIKIDASSNPDAKGYEDKH